MSLINFPNPQTYEFPDWVLIGNYYYRADEIIHFGGEITVENLLNAYQKGIFPWTIDDIPLPWFCPEKRAVLEFEDLHITKSLQKVLKKTSFTVTFDQNFREVITNCAKVKRNHEAGTWIRQDFIEGYTKLHQLGKAHSVEVWDGKNLIGGLYGVDANGVFCGESMFHFSSNASKVALVFLIDHLKSRGATWLDAQVMTPHLKLFGAKEISRQTFLKKLEETQKIGLKLF